MVKKIIKRVIIGVLVSIILTFIYNTFNANAVDFTQLVQYIGTWDITHSPVGNGTCVPNYQAGTSTVSAFWYVSNTSSSSPCSWNDSVLSLGGLGFNDKYIFQLDYYLYDIRDKEEINSYANQPPTLRMDNGRFPLNYIGADYKLMDSDSGIISYYFNIPYTNTLTTNDNFRVITNIGLQVNETIAMSSKMTIWSYYQSVGGNGSNGNYTQIINAINTVNNTIDSWSNTQTQRLDSILQAIRNNQQSVQNIDNSVQNIENNFEQQQQQAEEQGQQSQDDADESGRQTEENTQNLLGFLTSFFGAFTSAQATNCNMDWGLSQYGFGVIDMCSTQIPATFSIILSIITLLMVLPMILWLINSIINAFKEFQE